MNNKKKSDLSTNKAELQALGSVLAGTLLSRLNFFNQAGMQYGTSRDLNQALGYLKSPTYNDFMSRYLHQDIAKAIIDRPIKATWRGGISLIESDDDEETPLEKTWDDLYRSFKLRSVFTRLDKLSSIGQYGVLLLGLNDVKMSMDMGKPVASGKRELLYLKPLGEGSATINKWEEDPANPRYGLPLIYDIAFSAPGDRNNNSLQRQVHYSRVIHVIGEKLESEVDGVPVLEAVLNCLFNIEKIVGGDAEAFWRLVKPGFLGKLDKDAQIPEGFIDDLKTQFDEFEHNLRRILIGVGLEDMKSLAQAINDNPDKHLDIQMQLISAVTGIPKRILVGSERGELASTEDTNQWKELIKDRREDHAEPNILNPFVETLTDYGILPKHDDNYSWEWQDLWSQSEKEKAEIGKIRAEAIRAYAGEPTSELVVTPGVFRRNMLGLTDEEIEMIEEEQGQAVKDEANDFNGADDMDDKKENENEAETDNE